MDLLLLNDDDNADFRNCSANGEDVVVVDEELDDITAVLLLPFVIVANLGGVVLCRMLLPGCE